MEARLRWTLITAIAPVAWGSTYFVTHHFLPASHPLYGAAIRALPAGLGLLVLRRRLPRGSWWWRSGVLGVLNVGAFFALIYVAAQRLPTSLASTIMATSPVAMMLIAWALLRERPRLLTAAASLLGVFGVCLMVLTGSAGVDRAGVAASLTAMLLSALGFVLTKRWSVQHGPVDVLASTAWQLVAGGLLLLPFALAVEGPPPTMDERSLLGFGYLTVVATAVAFSAWFTGLRHLSAGAVGVVGLLNPVTGVLLGTAVAAEALSARQILGVALVLAGVLASQVRPGVRRPAVPPAHSNRVVTLSGDAADTAGPDMV